MSAVIEAAAGLAVLCVQIFIWWHVRGWWHARGIQARDERDPRDGDIGTGWTACPTCRGGVR